MDPSELEDLIFNSAVGNGVGKGFMELQRVSFPAPTVPPDPVMDGSDLTVVSETHLTVRDANQEVIETKRDNEQLTVRAETDLTVAADLTVRDIPNLTVAADPNPTVGDIPDLTVVTGPDLTVRDVPNLTAQIQPDSTVRPGPHLTVRDGVRRSERKDSPTTVRGALTVRPGLWVAEDGTKIFAASRVHPVRRAQDAMTAHEERMYRLLWGMASEGDRPESRLVRIGYGRLGASLGIHRQSAAETLRRLVLKSILEEVEPGDSFTRTAALYRIHSFVAILQKLEAAGRGNYVNSGNGVIFVTPNLTVRPGPDLTARVESDPTVGENPTAGVGAGLPLTVRANLTPLGTTPGGIPDSKLVSSIVVGVREFFLLDDGAVKIALAKAEPGLKIHEAVYFARRAANKIVNQKNVHNQTALWITQFSAFASGTALSMYRDDAAREREDFLTRMGPEVWRAVLDNPKSPEEEKRRARLILDL